MSTASPVLRERLNQRGEIVPAADLIYGAKRRLHET